jgi:hypothetical protein
MEESLLQKSLERFPAMSDRRMRQEEEASKGLARAEGRKRTSKSVRTSGFFNFFKLSNNSANLKKYISFYI